MVGGADPDRHGALVIGRLTGERRAALSGYSDLVFEVVFQTSLHFDPQKPSTIRAVAERVRQAPAAVVAVEDVLKGARAGNVRGILYGVLCVSGCQVHTAAVSGRGAWWRRGRVDVGDPVRGAAETVSRWVIGLDFSLVPGTAGTGEQALHRAGLLQAACIARWNAVQREEKR